MAYEFNGSNQRLSVSSAPVTATPVTLYARFHTTATQTGAHVYLYLGDTANSNYWMMRVQGAAFSINHIGDTRQQTPTATSFVQQTATVASGTWYSGALVESAINLRNLWIDTTKSANNTSSVTPGGVNFVGIGARNAANFFNGLVAECALWNDALTDDEVTSLARGFKPFRVRPQNLQFYAPIVRELQDLRGALTITNNNAATVADHPRVY